MKSLAGRGKESSIVRNLIFGIVAVSIFFAALEIRQRIRHPQVGFRGMTNSMGFRSPEFNPEKDPKTPRVLFIGSSTTFGVEGPIEKTFPSLVCQPFSKQVRQDMQANRFLTANIFGILAMEIQKK